MIDLYDLLRHWLRLAFSNAALLSTPQFPSPPPEALEAVRDAFNKLDPRRQEVLKLRYGRNKSLKDTGLEILNLKTGTKGITDERVRQMELMALRRMRDPRTSSVGKAMKDYIETHLEN